MRAATIRDGTVVVELHPDPEPGTGEVLVRVRASGLNRSDIVHRDGAYPVALPGSLADIPGIELAGEVVGLGPGAARFCEGARVMGIVNGGGHGELAVVHERQLMAVPDNLSWVEAGGVPEVFTTAHDALFTQVGLSAGERLLVHGAAGGVGTAAVQLGAATGAHVTATVRDRANRDRVAQLGAAVVLDPEAFEEHGPFDVVLELVSAQNLPGNLQALAPQGRISIIGMGAGREVALNLLPLASKRATVRGSVLRSRSLEEKATTAREMERHVLPLLERGIVSVPVAATYGLDDVAAAYERFTAGGKLGKIVLSL